jgi:hypothetical protein
MNKLYLRHKYLEFLHNTKKIDNSYKIYYELIINKDLWDDIIRESDPQRCVDCGLVYNEYYRRLFIIYKYLLTKINSNIIDKLKKNLIIIDNVCEDIFFTGHNTMIYYDHICSFCINDNNKHKLIFYNI